jgi:hypothetical protein
MITTLRIPIARLGRWYHPVYKNDKGEPVVEFNQADFDSMKNAFRNDDRGYEPYLTYGHVKALYDKTTNDGFPIEGYLTKMEQVDDVLYGEFTPTNPKVVELVKDGKYRYASGEFIRGLPSKANGDRVRVFLKGVALTNTPFVPNLPLNAVKHVSEDTNEEYLLMSESIELGDNAVMTENQDKLTCPTCDQAVEVGCTHNATEEVVVVERPENTVPNMVENIEDVKEVKNLLSELVTLAKNFFTKPEATEKTEEIVETPSNDSSLTEEAVTQDAPQVINEENNVEDTTPELNQELPVEEVVEVEAPVAVVEDAPVVEEPTDLDAAKKDLEDKLAALEAEKAALEAEKVALSERVSSYENERLAAIADAKESQLSEQVNGLVSAGLAPAVADRVKALVSSTSDSVISLSEGDEVSLGDAVLDLVKEILKPENRIELEQVGATADTATLSDDAGDPWAATRAKYSQLRQTK